MPAVALDQGPTARQAGRKVGRSLDGHGDASVTRGPPVDSVVVSTRLTGLQRARLGVASTFLLHAAMFGTWAPRLPAIKAKLELGNDDIGLALGGLAIGMFVGTRLVGRLERGARTGRAMKVVLAVQALALVGPSVAWNLLSLTIALAVLGVLGGALDVLMNVHAVAVERLYRRPIMSSFHGLWSSGSMVAGGLAALAAGNGLDVRWHFALAGAACVAVSVPLLSGLLDGQAEASAGKAHEEQHGARGPTVGIAVVGVLALMGFGAFLGEGAIADWSAIFLHDNGASPGLSALGFTVFSGAMAASRLTADRVGQRIGPVALARGGALLAIAGYLVFLIVPSPAVALTGFALAGVGIGPAVPIVFSAAGNSRSRLRASVLSIAVSASYLGTVVGPMAIGWVAEHVGLAWALSGPLAFLTLVAVAAGLLRNAARADDTISPASVTS